MPENSNIVSLETVIVDIPLKRLQRFARFDARAQSSLIVRIRCKSGVEGIGESIVPCGPWWSGDSIEAMQIMVERYIAPEIIGLPALHVDPIMARLAKSVRGANFAKTGVEMALMDLAGKLAGQPVHVLLGGRARSACPVAWPIASGDHDEDAAEMNHMLENGFACAFKVKMGATEIDADVARIRKLLDALDGRAGLRVDPNEAWQETDALRVMPMLEEAGVELVEQPVPREQMAAMANITARARVPVMIDEGAQSEAGALETVRLKAAHIVSLKLMKAGGLRASKRMADIAAAGGLALYMGTFLESSLGTAADLQLAATLETLPYGGEIVGPMLLADDIVTQPIVYENGAAILPEGPGLGVALDEDKVRSLTRR